MWAIIFLVTHWTLDDVYDRGWIIQKSDGVTIILRVPQTGVDIKPFCGEISIGTRDPWLAPQKMSFASMKPTSKNWRLWWWWWWWCGGWSWYCLQGSKARRYKRPQFALAARILSGSQTKAPLAQNDPWRKQDDGIWRQLSVMGLHSCKCLFWSVLCML